MDIQIDQLKDYASIFKDVIFTLGIIIGGIWAYFKFRKLNVYKESILKIEELEKKLKEQPIVKTSVEATLKILGNDRYILGEIIMINSGNRNTFLEFHDSLCTATEVDYNIIEETFFGKLFNGFIDVDSIVLKAGNQIIIPFIIKVNNSDIFLIDFWINVPKKDQELYQDIYNDLGVQRKAGKIYWGTQKYIMDESK
jgi:hypothetical protein